MGEGRDQQSHTPSPASAARAACSGGSAFASLLARRSALRRQSVVHTRGMSVLVHACSRPAFAKPAAAAAAAAAATAAVVRGGGALGSWTVNSAWIAAVEGGGARVATAAAAA